MDVNDNVQKSGALEMKNRKEPGQPRINVTPKTSKIPNKTAVKIKKIFKMFSTNVFI